MERFNKHPFGAFYSSESEILILGSFPSPKSREDGFYYGNKKNRFWMILAMIYDEETPDTIEEKQALLAKHNIALFDAIDSLMIQGASDASIKNAKPSDLSMLFASSKIRLICCNGKTAYRYFLKGDHYGVPSICLPSSSPANASFSLDELTKIWRKALLKR